MAKRKKSKYKPKHRPKKPSVATTLTQGVLNHDYSPIPADTTFLDSHIVYYDTREQIPWDFFHAIEMQRRTLHLVDYKIEGFSGIGIERKTGANLASNLTMSHDRALLKEKCAKLQETFDRSLILVEESLADCAARCGGRHQPKANPLSVYGTIASWSQRYPNVEWMFAGSRKAAMVYAMHWFKFACYPAKP